MNEEESLKLFLKSGELSFAKFAVDYCRNNQSWIVGKYLCKYFLNIFPNNEDILFDYAFFHFSLQEYKESYNLFQKLLTFPLEEKVSKRVLMNQHFCIPHIKDNFIDYPKDIVQKLKQVQSPFPLITFTITTCKRYDLFEKTMNSFLNCCTDLFLIDKWFCVDDNSSEEDRKKMQENYPFFEFYFKTKKEKGHPQSMNLILEKVKTPYIFHMEDDWKFFCKAPYISQCLQILSTDEKIGQCLINKNYAETETDIHLSGGKFKQSGTLRYYIHEHPQTEEEKIEFSKKYGGTPSCSYWPHFSFRPSLLRRKIFDEIGSFDEKVSHFEMQYSYKYRDKGYVSAFLEGIYSLHIGRLTSERNDETKLNAYVLNDEKQLYGKEEVSQVYSGIKIKTKILNLERRQDRWNTFLKNNQELKFLNYEKYKAIDGNLLLPTEQLQRIFDGNDYNMRKGMVGCAMSHIKMYIELLQDSDTQAYCILEDDITHVPDFKEKFEHLCSLLSLSTEKGCEYDWDICYLGHHVWKHQKKDGFYDKEAYPFIEKHNATTSLQLSMGGTGGYLISKKGATALLEYINSKGMINGIDTVQQKSADFLHVYYSIPHLIYADCWTPETNPDTDIQHCYESLTISSDARYQNDLIFYRKVYNKDPIVETDYEKALLYAKNKEEKDVLIFFARNFNKDYIFQVKNLLQSCVHPCYSISYECFVCVPEPLPEVLDKRYFERLKKSDSYNISEALTCVSKFIFPIADNTHLAEACKVKKPDNPFYFFDTMDNQTVETVFYLLEIILNFKDDKQLENFIFEFCSPEKNIIKNNIVHSERYNVSFPHETPFNIVETYLQRAKNTIKAFTTGSFVDLYFASRFKVDCQKYFSKLEDWCRKEGVKLNIFSINGKSNKENYTEIEFPEKFLNTGWTEEKIRYDQDIYRVAVKTKIT